LFIALLITGLYFVAKELLLRRILTLPQLAAILVFLTALGYFLPKYGGQILALVQRLLPQLLSMIF
jgi:hypothetical protein|tara:strand:- start:1000 stop:1197 length:198 start_codon:yes stop_codon:yes gene_type:complete